MSYITITQLSKKWQVTPRYIQNLCRDGRLPGVVRMGKIWLLPDNITRPYDNRRKRTVKTEIPLASQEEICRSVIGAEYRVPGTEKELLEAMPEKSEARELAEAQFAYLHGDINKSEALSEKLSAGSDDFEIQIGAAFLMSICAIYNGDVDAWKNAKERIDKLPCIDKNYEARKELWLAVNSASIYDISGYSEWFRHGCFDRLPAGYYPAARVHYIKYLYILGDMMVKNQSLSEQSLSSMLFLLPAICEPLISETVLDRAIVSEIYLRLFCASSYHHAGNDKLAAEHVERALKLALPDRIIAPLAEQRGNLDSLIDDRIKKLDTEAYSAMKNLHQRMIDGWSVVHNSVLGRSHTTILTNKELEAARLAAFGLTNIEIAKRMNISVNSVKAYLQSAKEKTGVTKRSELAKFV